jgi:hypothetical protein
MDNSRMWRCLAGTNRAEEEKRVSKDSLVVDMCSRRFKPNPYAYHLAQREYSVFGTLTWQNESLTVPSQGVERLRHKQFESLINYACCVLSLRKRHLEYYVKSERGPANRIHYNFLIGKEGCSEVRSGDLAAILQVGWRYGRAVIEPFDSSRKIKAILYQSKPEYDSMGNQIMPIEYFSTALLGQFRINAMRN